MWPKEKKKIIANIKHAKFLYLTVWKIKQNKFTYLPNRESFGKIFGYFSAGWIKKLLEHQTNTLKWAANMYQNHVKQFFSTESFKIFLIEHET